MIELDSKYKLSASGVISFEYNKFLNDFYLPFIGHKAYSLYLILENNFLEGIKEGQIKDFLSLSTYTIQDFILQKQILESCGLLKTYFNKNTNSYIFNICPILLPNEFNESFLLSHLLIDTIGENKYKTLITKYKKTSAFKDYEDVSAKFEDSFKIEYEIKEKDDGKIELIGSNKSNISSIFDTNSMMKYIVKKSNIIKSGFSKDELFKLGDLGSLYGISPEALGQIVINHFNYANPVGEKVDFEGVKTEIISEVTYNKTIKKVEEEKPNIIDSDTKLAKKINEYEITSPALFLKNLQNGISPVASDLRIIQDLSNMGLKNGVINVLVDYTIFNCNGSLSRSYIEKIASAFLRKNIKTSLDAYDYLYGTRFKSNKTNKSIDNKNAEDEEIVLTDEELEDLF